MDAAAVLGGAPHDSGVIAMGAGIGRVVGLGASSADNVAAALVDDVAGAADNVGAELVRAGDVPLHTKSVVADRALVQADNNLGAGITNGMLGTEQRSIIQRLFADIQAGNATLFRVGDMPFTRMGYQPSSRGFVMDSIGDTARLHTKQIVIDGTRLYGDDIARTTPMGGRGFTMGTIDGASLLRGKPTAAHAPVVRDAGPMTQTVSEALPAGQRAELSTMRRRLQLEDSILGQDAVVRAFTERSGRSATSASPA